MIAAPVNDSPAPTNKLFLKTAIASLFCAWRRFTIGNITIQTEAVAKRMILPMR